MSEHLHPGVHLDADSLSAFIEGVLPEHERLQCLSHLAECARCRELAFLAREPQLVPVASDPVPLWWRWFAPVPVLSAAAVTCLVVVASWLYLHRTPEAAPRDVASRDLAGQARRPIPPVAPSPTPPLPRLAVRPKVTPEAVRLPATAARTMELPGLPAAPSIAIHYSVSLPPTLPGVTIKDDRGPADGLSKITGTVTDPTGAFIQAATVTLQQRGGPFSTNSQTDSVGQFELAGLPAGEYELRIEAPGFRQESQQIDLRSQDVAAVSSQLTVGAVAETVEVTAAVPLAETSTSSTARVKRRPVPAEPRPLPSKLPATITAVSGKVMLAVDSAGALFRSQNAGKSWKAIKRLWPGKVVRVEPLQTPAAAFQLTTDSGSAWLSRDGSRWFAAPPPR